ncbi:MAG: hypothetical protein U1A27_04220 [Phycisphaerae bacterium]
MTTTVRILAALFMLAAAWLLTHPPQADRSAAPATGGRRVPTSLPADAMFHGMAIQLHGGDDTLPTYHRLVDEVADLGADSLLLVTHGWQTHAGTADLHVDPLRNPSLAGLQALCSHARQRGLRVVVMPVVLLSNPRGTEWRGQINPTVGWDEWFRRYTDFIVEHARVCEQSGVTVLMIGSELIKTEQFTDRWRSVIAAVREVYSGKLAYSANWDHYTTKHIGFWPYLDYVGMTSYYKLAEGPRPTLADVLNHWRPIKRRIAEFYREIRKPILFTEAGWCSQEGAAEYAWNYYNYQHATPEGHQEQLTCYEGFLRTWADAGEIRGIFWWEWSAADGGPNDFNYTPKGKPAEKLMRDWFDGKWHPSSE